MRSYAPRVADDELCGEIRDRRRKMREGQVSHVADDEQAVVTDAPPRLNQCCVGDIET